jgi:hypothetical protein
VRMMAGIMGSKRNEAILGWRKYEYTEPDMCHKLLLEVQNQNGME